jgi:hypothetical protein
VWLINAKLVNEAKINSSWNGQRIPPVGENWKRETYGFAFPQLYAGGRFDNGIPDTTIGGFAVRLLRCFRQLRISPSATRFR